MTRQRKDRGFTLVEILVALSITSLISLILLIAFSGITRSGKALKSYSERYRQSVMAMEQILRDFTGILYSTDAPFTHFSLTERNLGGEEASEISFSTFSLQFTKILPGGTDIIAVHYKPVLSDDGETLTVSRVVKINPQVDSFKETLEDDILRGISSFTIEASPLDSKAKEREWDSDARKAVPDKIAVTLAYPDGYTLTRTFYLPVGTASKDYLRSGRRKK